MINSMYEKVLFKDIISEMHQGINTAADKVEYVDVGMPIIQSRNFTSGKLSLNETKFISPADVNKYGEKYKPKKGDVLFSNIGTVGKSVVVDVDSEFLFAWNVFLIRPKSKLLFNSYLQHYLDYLLKLDFYERWFTGGTVKFLNKKTISGFEIPLPPLAEQQKIAAILDAADSLRQKDQQLVERYTRLSQSLFLEMFGDPVTNPMGWEINRWSDILYIKNGKNQKAVEELNGKYPIYGSGGNVMAYANQFICNENTVIIGRKGNINKPVLIKEKFWNVDTAFGLQAKPEKLSYLYLYWFCVFFNFETLNKTVTIPSLTKSDLLRITTPLPPIALQNQFAERIKLIEAQKQQAQASLQKSEALFNSLLQQAFTGALTRASMERAA